MIFKHGRLWEHWNLSGELAEALLVPASREWTVAIEVAKTGAQHRSELRKEIFWAAWHGSVKDSPPDKMPSPTAYKWRRSH